MKEVFPKAELLCFFEWFYHPRGSDANFDPSEPLNADDLCRIRVKNAPILIDLYNCNRGLTPTNWQHQQFPPEYHDKIPQIRKVNFIPCRVSQTRYFDKKTDFLYLTWLVSSSTGSL